MQKKIIIWHSYLCKIGGVETFLYNLCEQIHNYYDITVLTTDGYIGQYMRLAELVKIEKYDANKTYKCDVCLRNSVWGIIPYNIEAEKYLEMQHANYVHLKEKGKLDKQCHKWDKIQTHIACGEFVGKMYKQATGNDYIVIRNILANKKKTKKVYRFITCSRLDSEKGWNRMQKMVEMLRNAGILFEWNIFTDSEFKSDYEEIHIWKPRYDIFDYLANADYTVLLSDSEGLPYTVQESLQYDTPCIVTDIGGCTELIQDGINGYVVPLDMNFDINKIKKVPKISNYEGTTKEDWFKVLGEPVYKEGKVNNVVKVKVLRDYNDGEKGKVKAGDILTITKARAEYLIKASTLNKKKPIIEIVEIIEEKAVKPKEKIEKAVSKKNNAKK